jgi:hypothetical protein
MYIRPTRIPHPGKLVLHPSSLDQQHQNIHTFRSITLQTTFQDSAHYSVLSNITMRSALSVALAALFLSVKPTLAQDRNFNDIFYLSNCASVSQISYYLDAAQSQNGQTPDSSVQVSPPGNLVIWEGQEVSATFGSEFKSFINADAFGQPAGTQVGKGQYVINNCLPIGSGWSNFNCFRDTGRVLYEDPALGACASLYYCTNVSLYLTLVG